MVFDPVKYVYSIHPLFHLKSEQEVRFFIGDFSDRFRSLVWVASIYQVYTDGISVDRIRFVTRYHNNEPPRRCHTRVFDDFCI